MQPFNIAVEPKVGDDHLDCSSGEPIVGGLKIGHSFDVGIDLEYAEQHAQVRAVGLDDEGLIRLRKRRNNASVRQEWHFGHIAMTMPYRVRSSAAAAMR